MNCDFAVGLLLQVTGTSLGLCGVLMDDRQTQLLGTQIRHIGRLRMHRKHHGPDAAVPVPPPAQAATTGPAAAAPAPTSGLRLFSANDSGT